MMQNPPMFVTWSDERSKNLAFATASRAMNKVEPINRSSGSAIFKNIDTNTSVRDGITRMDYEWFRPEETVPIQSRRIIAACMNAYKRNGIVRNVIDLMGDFTCQGIRILHPNKKIQEFYRQWARKIHLEERSERFCNYFYRIGNVVVRRTHAKLKPRDVKNLQDGNIQETQFFKAAVIDEDVQPPEKIGKREIPWSYMFINPLILEPMGGEELSIFAGRVLFAIRIPKMLANKIRNTKKQEEQWLVDQMPGYIVSAIKDGKDLVPLDPQKITLHQYKKDDWQLWADPMIYAILDDLIMLNKLKLADLAALDGAISHIRLWRLGSLEHKILPTEAAVSRLSDMLLNSVGGGSMDLIWGPELDLTETATDIYKFLGSAKYGITLANIYSGLGIPATLTGEAGSKGGFTNNFVSLKVLTERLNYGRKALIEFWEKEVHEIHTAFDFSGPLPTLQFDRMLLSDEAAEKALIIQLVDRHIISIETAQERFGEFPELERLRMKREARMRGRGQIPALAGPWDNPQHDKEMEKILLQGGSVAPSELGIELSPKKDGELSPNEQKSNLDAKNKDVAGKGRPVNSKDSKKRKQKRVLPRNKTAAGIIHTFSWARAVQEKINSVINPVYLLLQNKKNMRSLSDVEFKNIENLKFGILCNINTNSPVNDDSILEMMNKPLPVPEKINVLYKTTLNNFPAKFEREPSIDETRQMQAAVYAFYNGETDGEN